MEAVENNRNNDRGGRGAKTKKEKGSRKAESYRSAMDEIRRCDEEGFTLVGRKEKKPAACNYRRDIAPNVLELCLRSEVPATPLYVSRLTGLLRSSMSMDYIQKKTSLRLRVERLQSRHKIDFNSFVVRVPTYLLPTLEMEDFWPKDVVYRRFRGRLRNEAHHIAVNA